MAKSNAAVAREVEALRRANARHDNVFAPETVLYARNIDVPQVTVSPFDTGVGKR